uniref:Uncharacterized protein n=1 Tax=Glossina brevipalpis TaxID=37001 RepID=A0A1A9WED8_9MUSC
MYCFDLKCHQAVWIFATQHSHRLKAVRFKNMREIAMKTITICMVTTAWAFVIIFVFFYPNKIINKTPRIYMKICVAEEHISIKDIDFFLKWNFSYVSKGGKCFLKCFFGKIGLMVDGAIQKEVAIMYLMKVFDREIAEYVFGQCVHAPNKNICETAYQVAKCFYDYEYDLLAKEI